MRAIVLSDFGDTDNLIETELAQPNIGSEEVLIKVKAISINPVDVKTRKGMGLAGRLKSLDPLILGWDISGVVEMVGISVTQFKPGDEVFGMVNFPGHGKAYAEYVAAPASHLALKPANISFEEAAAATLAALTALQALVTNAKVKKGDRIFVHAAAGGVGHYAVQLGRHLGAYVTGTSSAPKKDFVMSLGADAHIDYTAQPFEAVAREMDFVLDTVGGENIDRSLEIVKKGGTLISIPSGLSEDVAAKAKEKGVNGYFFLVQSNGKDMQILAQLLKDGTLKSHVSKVFEFNDIAAAHKQVESGKTQGKVVVKL